MPYVEGTQLKVRMIALDHLAYGWEAPEIQRQHPELTLAQVHSALAYYYDHKGEMDADLAERRRFADEMREKHGEATESLKEKLQACGAPRPAEGSALRS